MSGLQWIVKVIILMRYEVQEHELALMREYESVIVQRESEALDVALAASNSRSEHLARVGRLLRAVMRKLGGEDIQAYERMSVSEGSSAFMVEVSSSAISATDHTRPEPNENSTSTVEDKEDSYAELARELDGEEEPDRFQRRLAAAEWALERESELARLEQENEELRRLLKGVLNADASAALPAPAVPRPEPPSGERVQSGRTSPALSTSSSGTVRRQLGGPAGTVGPFGTYKKRVSG
ncbi:uncharacterized protein FIBRA_00407 [Fibroporia radiculosa]|uniref:Uncharacterized protein n=1 Tax=Fibroporia radiculosa TaxID=599839 RepID=J4GHP9_9APHY|nr:uncharacterized protein FIBRA_00407 [Fibroporia radiculosa]CCL98410.1 predicted protein [Fibroporia radiculosa]